MTERLWAPWRTELFQQPKGEGCLFCRLPAEGTAADSRNLILHRGEKAYLILNKFPYAAGHLMVVPFAHTDDIGALAPVAGELFALAAQAMESLKKVMSPDGFNLGVNLGKSAGAGIEGHGHLHVVPRWAGDNNFMPVLADRRVMPEALQETLSRLKAHF